MDLYTWLCALYIDDEYRGNGCGMLLIEQAKADAKSASFQKMYLCTHLIGYYEKYNFNFIGVGYSSLGGRIENIRS